MSLSHIPLSRLENDHRAACRWLDLPHADLWPDEKAKYEADRNAIWAEIQRRRAGRFERSEAA